jgi:hypothetical protein
LWFVNDGQIVNYHSRCDFLQEPCLSVSCWSEVLTEDSLKVPFQDAISSAAHTDARHLESSDGLIGK